MTDNSVDIAPLADYASPSRDFKSYCVRGHSVAIFDRGGERKLFDLKDLASVEYSRELNETSNATVKILANDCAWQKDLITSIEPMRHELVIYRGDERVWEGPIVNILVTSDDVTIAANDVFYYLWGTVLSKHWSKATSGLWTTHIHTVMGYEFTTPYTMVTGQTPNTKTVTVQRWETIDPPANVWPHVKVIPGAARTTNVREAFQQTLGDYFHTPAVDKSFKYVTVGRQIIFWSPEHELGRLRAFSESDFLGSLTVNRQGKDFAAIVHTAGQARDTTTKPLPPLTTVGHAGETDPYYGCWEYLSGAASDSQTGKAKSQNYANKQAEQNLVGRNPVPFNIDVPSGVGLALRGDIDVADLVPGVTIPVRATLGVFSFQQDQELSKVSVKEDSSGEVVSITLKYPSLLVDVEPDD